jgi:signal transduction histidine kinase
MRNWPLAKRLLVATLLIVALVLPIGGAALYYSFAAAVTAAFDHRLRAVTNVLTASVRLTPDGYLSLTRSLGDPRFDQVFSGWYWQVADEDGVLLVSRSLWDEVLAPLPAGAEGAAATLPGPRAQPLRVVQETIQLPGVPQPLHLIVAGPTAEIEAETVRFQRLLILTLATLGILLMALLAAQIRWGLSPLRHLNKDLESVRRGKRPALEERLPPDLSGLAQSMNAVLERDRQLIERGRTAAGNLAHALKTPLAVMKTQVEQLGEPHRTIMHREIERIDLAVRHHLARSSAAGTVGMTTECDIDKALQPVVEGLQCLAARQGKALEHSAAAGLTARVDPQDLQEIVGNLLENAVRWAEQRVVLVTELQDGALYIQVDDDGPGMPPEQRTLALDRGVGLDSARSQTGLGLDIVRDVVELYGGRVQLGDAPAGGLRVEVSLPRPDA